MGYRLDVTALVERLGGINRIVKGLEEHGLPTVSPVGVMRWVERQSILSSRLADLLVLAYKSKIPIDIYDFVVKAEDSAQAGEKTDAAA